MTDIVVCSGIAGGRADEVGVFMYNGKFGTIRDSIKLEIPPLEEIQGPEFGLSINKAGVTDIGVQIEMAKEFGAQNGMWHISDEKTKGNCLR